MRDEILLETVAMTKMAFASVVIQAVRAAKG